MADEKVWTAALVVIGDEILSGRTQDKNIAQVATWLNVPGHPAGRGAGRARRRGADRRGGQRAARRPRLSVHHRRHRPDPRRHHRRLRSPRRSACRWSSIPRRARSSSTIMPTRGGLTEARLRMARVPEGAELIRQPDVGRARHPDRQCLHPGRRAAHRRRHARRADRHAGGRAAAGLGDRRRLRPGKRGRRPAARDGERPTRASRSAAIPSSRTAGYGANFVDPLRRRRSASNEQRAILQRRLSRSRDRALPDGGI